MALAGNRGNNVLDDAGMSVLKHEMFQLQREVSNLRNRLASFGMRRHQTVYMPGGLRIKLGSLAGALNAGSSATVTEIVHNADGAQELSGEDFTAWDFLLNSGESIDTDTKVVCAELKNDGVKRWVVIDWYCAVSDTIPE